MADSYQYLDDMTLNSLLDSHRRNLALLEEQAAKFGSLLAPLPLIRQISDERDEISRINQELRSRKDGTKKFNELNRKLLRFVLGEPRGLMGLIFNQEEIE